MKSPPSGPPEPIPYGIFEHNGVQARPDSVAIVKKAIDEGAPIEISKPKDYINLYHVFGRLTDRREDLKNLRMVRRKVSDSKWYVLVVRDDTAAPEVPVDPTWDPKRGRYKRYAAQLAKGEAVRLPSKTEAKKARRAWRYYTPAAERENLTTLIRKVSRTAEHIVLVVARTMKT